MKRKVLAILLILCLTCTVGCGKGKEKDSKTVVETTSETIVQEEPEVTQEEEVEEPLIKNGDFSQPNDSPEMWQVYTQGGGASFFIAGEQGVLTVATTGSLTYGVQLYQDIGALKQGCVYKLQFDISANVERTIEYRIQINGGDYHAYCGKEDFRVTKEMQTETLEFEFKDESDPAPRFVFNCGAFEDTEGLGEHEIYIDNVSLELVDDSKAVEVEIQEAPTKDINVNQIGYLPNEKKIAVFRGDTKDDEFTVINTESNETVFTGKIGDAKSNTTAGETNYYGDFSEVTTPGTYKITTNSFGESYEFKIGDGVYDSCYADSVLMLYKQRCGSQLDEGIAGKFAHAACHTGEAKIFGTDKKLDVSGGWHDAGDYGRYIVAGAKTVKDLFLTFEQNDMAKSDELGIPESGNKVPDLLDEARYELEWMLKMQDSKSGGVYHKVTCASFPGDDVLPQDETEELIISPISIAATYDFAAVMAEASTLYADYDQAFAKKCLSAAKKAMDYGEKDKMKGGFTNPEGISTGEYPDSTTRDERYWASAEMYKVTQNDAYLDNMEAIVKNDMPKGFGWQAVGDYGTFAFLTTEGVKEEALYKTLTDYVVKQADKLVEDSNKDGYFISIGTEYCWGSNAEVANNAMFLILANQVKENASYLEIAQAHLHYFLGVNPMSICYVTGYGSYSPVNPHHRPTYALGEVMTGMLVGGPDKSLEDPYARAVLSKAPAAKCYVDNHASYSTNEITIYWNSPYIFTMNALK